ncbi:EAL domain-containing protein [Azovibrio restrictus]|uniref:bifunctional diguanylate cyclase/phosphodiesterase n=1 Tax=Azovibrio restrictus TaxID=146938 RepID=UPI0026F305B6|nr:EAL domain-containing protein [Azovibrio restrictus]
MDGDNNRVNAQAPEGPPHPDTPLSPQPRNLALEAARNAVLDRLVADAPLTEILEDVVHRLEQLEPSMRATVLLMDPDGTRLTTGAAPSFPDYYVRGVDGMSIGEGQGSCGTAAFRRAPVIVSDVSTDPLWAPYPRSGPKVGFRACWSFPFYDGAGKVLGTFAVYFAEPREKDERIVQLIEGFSGLTALAVQKVRATTALRQAAAIIESTRDGVMVTDLERRIVSVNPAWCAITGFSAEEALGRAAREFRSELQDDAFYQDIWDQVAHQGYWQGEVWTRRKNGEIYPLWLKISRVHNDQGQPSHYVIVMTDISQLRESQARLERLAHYDPLTGLPNRLLVQSRLEHAIEQAAHHHSKVGVLCIDLDHFKTINESLGHPAGDELLRAIGKRLGTALRTEDTFARWAGDEFLVVVENVHHPDELATLAANLIQLTQEPFTLASGQTVYLGASIGIALYPQDAGNAPLLLQHTDTALHQAKDQGRNTYRFFTEAMGQTAQQHLELGRRLRMALEQGSFILHYQPKLDVATGRMVGCEALLRWNDPECGLTRPDLFIPFAEESGLIVPIGAWALETACRQARQWLDEGRAPLKMAVNLSARQLWQADLPERIGAILASTGLPPDMLELELTESMIMGHEAEAVERLGQLRAMGISLAIDDFGTGYSSLSYLKSLPIQTLKIDQSFVRNIPADHQDMEISAGIIALARKLNLKVVAEGVETVEQLDFLTEQGCDQYQGYLYSRPLPADQFERLHPPADLRQSA